MKKSLLLLFIAVAMLSGCKNESAKKEIAEENIRIIKIKGSETIRPFIEKAIMNYEKNTQNVMVDYSGGGSNLGLSSLQQNESDLIFSSKTFTEDEMKDMPKDKTLQTEIIAYDALCIIACRKNPVEELTTEQLAGIYSGKITNWKELGGKDEPIQVYSRDISSGSYSFFKDKILANDNYSSTDINLVHNEEIVKNVRDKENAIGYVGLADATFDVKTIKIKSSGEIEFIAPSLANVKNKSYYLSRELTCMYFLESDLSIKEFIKFLKSEECKGIINEVGFLTN